MSQTLLAINEKGILREYPMSGTHRLLGDRLLFFDVATVYGYILNRRPKFEHKFYGWALER